MDDGAATPESTAHPDTRAAPASSTDAPASASASGGCFTSTSTHPESAAVLRIFEPPASLQFQATLVVVPGDAVDVNLLWRWCDDWLEYHCYNRIQSKYRELILARRVTDGGIWKAGTLRVVDAHGHCLVTIDSVSEVDAQLALDDQ